MFSIFSYLIYGTLSVATFASIQLNFTNLESPEGTIRLALYDNADDFPAEGESIYDQVVAVNSTDDISIAIPALANGQYALAVFHDVNGNGKLDKNMLGIPQEPYAFSNNAVAKWKTPSFKEAAFTFTGSDQTLNVTLKKWEDY